MAIPAHDNKETLPPYHAWETERCLKELACTQEGLPSTEATHRCEVYGANRIEKETDNRILRIFLAQFSDVLILLLVAATIISLALGEYLDGMAMFSIVILSAVLGFIQEFRAEKALEALQDLTAPQAKVRRDGKWMILDAAKLVPGDIIQIEAGDMIPADARILKAEQLQIDEASLTGESLPVEKTTKAIDTNTPLNDQQNMMFLGTSAVQGQGQALIVATGRKTSLGHIAEHLESTEEQRTPLQTHLDRIGRQIAIVVLVSIVIVFAVTLWQKPVAVAWTTHAVGMLIFALSLAVAAVPSSLPAIVTIGLSMGTKALARKQMIIKRLPAAEALGSVTVICSDKTGTLTKNQMTAIKLYTEGRWLDVTGVGYQPTGEFKENNLTADTDAIEKLLRAGFLCNNAQLTQQDGSYHIVGDPTEGSLRVLGLKAYPHEHFETFKRLKDFPFDSSRKMMSVLCQTPDGSIEAYAKGAPDLLLERCTHHQQDGQAVVLQETARQNIVQSIQQMASEALRVLAIAYRPLDTADVQEADDVEQSLVFLGLVGMLDPARDEVKDAIETTRIAGIRTIVITGDHILTAQAVAQKIGLYEQGDLVLSGRELGEMDDETLRGKLDNLRIIARALPEHKLRIVTLLQEKGEIVAMTGDGVNDAPALKKADVGLAMGITGTDVAKSVSKAILVDDNFATIVRGIEEGRGIYDKVIKSTRYLLSCNAGEIVTVFLAVVTKLPLPMLPLQLLLMNLVTDGLPALALAAEPTSHDVMKRPPRPPQAHPLQAKTLLLIGLFGLTMGLGTWFLFRHYVSTHLAHARTVAFTTLTIFEMFAVFGARSLRPFDRLNPLTNLWLLLAVVSSVGLQLLVIYWPPLQSIFKTVPLRGYDWYWILGLSAIGFLLMELSKFLDILTPQPKRTT